jgi:hypothetical protein
MGVAETVKELAESVAHAKMPTHPRHRLLVELLRLMPLYRDINGLCAWEAAFKGAMEWQDDESEVGQLLWDVFEFGGYNMYGAFDAEGTLQEFRGLASRLSERGVRVREPQGLDGW